MKRCERQTPSAIETARSSFRLPAMMIFYYLGNVRELEDTDATRKQPLPSGKKWRTTPQRACGQTGTLRRRIPWVWALYLKQPPRLAIAAEGASRKFVTKLLLAAHLPDIPLERLAKAEGHSKNESGSFPLRGVFPRYRIFTRHRAGTLRHRS